MKFILFSLLIILFSCKPVINNRTGKIIPKKTVSTPSPTPTTTPSNNTPSSSPDVSTINEIPTTIYNKIDKKCQPLIVNGNNSYIESLDNGVNWSSCNIVCDANFININGACLSSHQERACISQPINTIGGIEVSNDGGVHWSSCQNTICDSNSLLVNGQCLKKMTCTNQPQNSYDGFQVGNNTCQNFKCNNGYSLVANSCVQINQKKVCISSDMNSSLAYQFSTNMGSSWGLCQIELCKSGFSLVNNMCIQTYQTKSCLIPNGNGLSTSNDAGVHWTTCQLSNCYSGYYANGNSCLALNITRTCISQPQNSNGGLEYSYNGGNTWSTCQSYKCNDGYALTNGVCSKSVYSYVEPNNFDISKYSNRFLQYARLNGINIDPSMVSIKFNPSLTMTNGTFIVGYCVDTTKEIYLNSDWWNYSGYPNIMREMIIFHEMSHCFLGRKHDTNMYYDPNKNVNIPLTLMYPDVFDYHLYADNYNYYVNELFNPSINGMMDLKDDGVSQYFSIYNMQVNSYNHFHFELMKNGKILCK